MLAEYSTLTFIKLHTTNPNFANNADPDHISWFMKKPSDQDLYNFSSSWPIE